MLITITVFWFGIKTEELKNKIEMTLKAVSKPVTKTWDATSGYKTVTATVI